MIALWLTTLVAVSVAPHSASRSTLHSASRIAQRPDAVVLVAQETPPAKGAQLDKREPRTVTADFKNATCQQVLAAIAKQGDVTVTFTDDQMARCPRVTLKVTKAAVVDALNQALHGTPFTLFMSAPGRFVVVDRAAARRDSIPTTGTIQGTVRDTSGKPVVAARVMVEGSKQVVVTSDNGEFTLRRVPAGAQRLLVRVFGYRPETYPVTVSDEKTAAARIRLTAVPTALSGVVTTATGPQRKVEVGNDITTINVDSVMRIMPVSSFTDLLATRVPGLDVQRTSGAPGAPSRVRIRGTGSIQSTNDPIVILDGIRMYADQQRRKEEIVSLMQPLKETEAPSPLDQIDPNSIEKVEVLKGPSAVALYGTDAANGVIVVTTKRGKPQQARWDLSGSWGFETTPGKYPTNYFQWGTNEDGGVVHCYLGNVIDPYTLQKCTPDSMSTYQILNDKHTTVLGRGSVATYRTTVSGGTDALTYSLSGSLSNNTGMLKLSDADAAVLRSQGDSLPGWMRRPQGYDDQNLALNVTSNINPETQVTVSSGLTHSEIRTTPLSNALFWAANAAPGSDSLGGTTLLTNIPDFRERRSSRALRSFNAVTLTNNGFWGLNAQATGGIDVSNRNDLSTLLRDACPLCIDGGMGHYSVDRGDALVTSLNLRVSRMLNVGSKLSFRTSLGGNYVRTNTTDLLQVSSGLVKGVNSGSGADFTFTGESRDDRATAGVYVETTIGIADALYIPIAFRRDAGSALGQNVAPIFPKLSTSWLVSDQPFFHKTRLVNTLRLRVAYGQSGVQPGPAAKLRTYGLGSAWVDGQSVPSVNIVGLGNLDLKPERSKEFEGGFDIGTLDDRVTLGLTWYRRRTTDALVTHNVPFSVSGGGVVQENVGDVDNRGMEATVETTPFDSRAATWHVMVGVSKQKNKLVSLGQSGPLGVDSALFKVGYPLFGRWAQPIVAYGDLNHDGFLTRDEVQLGDSSIYLGAPYPNYEMSINSTLTLFTRFTVGATLNYQNGMNQYNYLLGGPYSQAWNDPSTSLGAQAYVGVAAKSNIGSAQTVSTLRFNALSLNYIIPENLTRRAFRGRQVTLALQGQNVGLWTNYRGKDPNVSSTLGDQISDTGVIPEPRTWQIALRIN